MPKTSKKIKLMLDSGAYTAWTKGEAINLKDYIAYIKENAELIDTFFNLDVIPGKIGEPRSPADLELGAKLSYQNLQKMKKAGLHPIPVFHQQEDFKWLHRMIADKEPYIALSTFKELSVQENQDWLDECFTILTDEDGNPNMKIHGLGIASFDLLKRYSWFTCDATSWALTAAFGAIFVPVYRAGQPDYTQTPVKLTVSMEQRKSGGLPPDHYMRYGPLMKARVNDFLENHVKTSIADVADNYVERARAIVYFFLRFQESLGKVKFNHRVRRLTS